MKITVKDKEYELEELHITGISSDEKEVTVSLGYLDDYVSVYTSDDAWFTKIKKHILTNPSGWEIKNLMFRSDGTLTGVKVFGPKKAFKLHNGLTKVLSDEAREANLEKLKRARSAKDSSRDK